MKSKLQQYNEIEEALEELKDDFKSQLQYIQEIQSCNNGSFFYVNDQTILENLDYLIRDNSELKHNHTTETRLRAIQVLKNWNDEIEGDQN